MKIHEIKEKKKVTWSLNLTEEKDFDRNKIKLDSKKIIACKHMFNHIKNVFAVSASNSMSYMKFKENYARVENSSVNEITARILLSLLPEAIDIKPYLLRGIFPLGAPRGGRFCHTTSRHRCG